MDQKQSLWLCTKLISSSQRTEETKMENVTAKECPNYLDAKVSDEDVAEKLEPKTVEVMDFKVEEVQKYGDKLVLLCKHPDLNDKLLEVSKVKYLQTDQVKQSGLWLKMDKEGKLPKSSAVAHMLKFHMVATVKEMKGKKVCTCVDDGGYLCVKSY